MKSIRDWVKRHRRVLLISAGAVGAGYILYRSIKAHHAKVVAQIEENEAHAALFREAKERFEAQLHSHFQNIQRISDATTLPSVLPRLKSQLLSQVDLSGLTEKLLQGKEAPQALSGPEKVEQWQELKILSFTRAMCSMWALTLLNLFVRVQLNILGRHVYFDTAQDISSSRPGEQRRTLSKGCQHKYIAFADFLPHKTLNMLIFDTKMAVEDVLMSKSLKEPCTLTDLREIFNSIHIKIEGNQANWLHYILPEENSLPDELLVDSNGAQYEAVEVALHDDDEKLEQLLIETRDVLTSNEFKEVLAVSFDAVLDSAMEEFHVTFQGGAVTHVPLAKLLPPVASVGALLLEQPSENKFIQRIASLQKFQAFCAMVYSFASER